MEAEEFAFGDDQPKRDPKDDRLGYAPFAERLANVVISMRAPNGYVIGLHGKWGAGKTTAVNFILEYIKKHNKEAKDPSTTIQHIEFRPWIVSGHQDLMAAFFKLLAEQLQPKEGKAKKLFGRGMRFAAGGADSLVDAAAALSVAIDPSGGVMSGLAGGLGKRALNDVIGSYLNAPSLQKAYEELRAQLAIKNRRFLVTIDDIDRLEDAEIKSIMQMVKTIGRLPNVVYMLVYDRDIVWQALDEDSDRTGPRFAEKIVQHEVELALPTKSVLFTMLDEETEFLSVGVEESTRWQYIVQSGVQRWINYPRDVLRFSNALKFAWPALRGEFDPQDLVAVEGIRLFDPVAFDWIRRNRDFLFSEGRYVIGGEEQRKADIEALRASLPPDTVNPVMELLAVLFPHHGTWFEGRQYMLAESYAASQARRGMSSEAGYDSYFALRPSSDAVPKSVIETILDTKNSEQFIERTLGVYLGNTNSRGQSMIGLLLQELRFHFQLQNGPRPSRELISALLSIGDSVFSIPWKGDVFITTPSANLRFLVRDLLEAWGEEDAGMHLLAAFERSESSFLLAELFVDRGRELGIFQSDDRSRNVISKEYFDKIGAILLAKIRRDAEVGSLANAPFYWNIVRAWKYLEGSDSVKRWISNGIEADGRFAAKIAKGMTSKSWSKGRALYSLSANHDEEIYDTRLIYESAKRQLDRSTELSDDDRELLKALVVGIDRIGAGKRPEQSEDLESS